MTVWLNVVQKGVPQGGPLFITNGPQALVQFVSKRKCFVLQGWTSLGERLLTLARSSCTGNMSPIGSLALRSNHRILKRCVHFFWPSAEAVVRFGRVFEYSNTKAPYLRRETSCVGGAIPWTVFCSNTHRNIRYCSRNLNRGVSGECAHISTA